MSVFIYQRIEEPRPPPDRQTFLANRRHWEVVRKLDGIIEMLESMRMLRNRDYGEQEK